MRNEKLTLFIIFLLFSCSTGVKIPVVEKSPPGFQEFMRGGKNVGLYVYKSEKAQMNELGDWKTIIHGAILNALQEYRYFKIVDVSSREARLKEVAYNQKMGNLKDISKELSIDALLFVEVPLSPAHECKSNTYTTDKQVCVASDAVGKCLRYEMRRDLNYVKELTFTVFANARLVNLETGQTRQYANSEPVILKNTSQTPFVQCPSLLQGFNKAVEKASYNIAENLSPKMTDMEVPIYDSLDGVDRSSEKEVEKLLSTGKKWLKGDTPNLEMAKTNWEKALSLSGGNSASALWNLGVYHWAKG
ncbi:MAG: hypothetical protein N3A69_07410, partial [Leptospiraceae bacterium]|nr:hypothetical protein [Leptospiraceae bacterium]